MDAIPLRCATAGSVDDGKSTLIGRLLLDAKALMKDQVAHVEEASRRRGFARTELALLTDGLRAEREQGITIDVAWRYFATPRRRFILADAPGHVQYTRNMVTAASVADVAIILVDARAGLAAQTRRHLFVTRLLGVRNVAIAINKMDQVGWSLDVFARLREEVTAYLARLDVPGRPPDLAFFPVSALLGDNVVDLSTKMAWYDGEALLAHLEALPAEVSTAFPARFPVQWVIRPQSDLHPDYRGYAGRLAAGELSVGQSVRVFSSGLETTVARIEAQGTDVEIARAGASIVVHLADDLDVGRGDLIAAVTEPAPHSTRELRADVAWVNAQKAQPGGRVLVKHGTREVRAVLEAVEHRWDIETGEPVAPNGAGLGLNDLGRVHLRLGEPLPVDPYAELRATGSFLVVDPTSFETLAAGMIRSA